MFLTLTETRRVCYIKTVARVGTKSKRWMPWHMNDDALSLEHWALVQRRLNLRWERPTRQMSAEQRLAAGARFKAARESRVSPAGCFVNVGNNVDNVGDNVDNVDSHCQTLRTGSGVQRPVLSAGARF